MGRQEIDRFITKKGIKWLGAFLLTAGIVAACGGNADPKVENQDVQNSQKTQDETKAGNEVGETEELSALEPTVITVGTLEENYDLNDMASRFQEQHPEYRIEVKVYGSGMYGDMDGLNDLRMEIVSGAGPDIINFGSAYSTSFAAGGIILDLTSWMEEEGMLNGEEYFANVFDAAKMGEERKVIFPSFSLISFVGKESLLQGIPQDESFHEESLAEEVFYEETQGEELFDEKTFDAGEKSWDIAEMEACYAAMPEGTALFLGDNKISVFAFLCMETMDSFVDWSAGTCDFTDARFVDMLKFTDYFSEELVLEEDFSYGTYYAQGRALLFPYTMEDVYATALMDALMGERAVFMGYPIDKSAGKQSGNLIKPGEIVLGIGANSGNQEAAWEYIKMFLAEEYQSAIDGELPVSRRELEKRLLQAQEPEFIVDEEGNSVKAVRAEMDFEGEDPIQITEITPEQGERLLQIVESADSLAAADREMYYIAREEAEMYLSGDRSAEDTAEVIQRRLSMYVGEKQ